MSSFFKSILCAAALGLVAGLPAHAAEFTARLGSQDPPTTAKHAGLVAAAASVAIKTKGAVEIQVFPSSQLGNGRQMIEGVQLGTIEAAITPAAFLGGFNPAVSILDIPYIMPSSREKARLLRDGVIIHDGVVSSLRRFKDDVREVASGFECGIGFDDYQDLKEGDSIEVYVIREVART